MESDEAMLIQGSTRCELNYNEFRWQTEKSDITQ